ncbi:MAG: isoprenylcysteine carboxylmethyltransferase family protein [Rhizobiales bacterium]|nr:isoprenylcysteine carboxylmethyltransferase family protein [Hyphomicrobiales bacterium]
MEKLLSARRVVATHSVEIFERLSVLILFGWLCQRIIYSLETSDTWYPLLLLASEALVVVFMLIRRSTQNISHHPWDWSLAFGAMLLPMLVMPFEATPLMTPGFCAWLLFIGFLLQLYAKLSLNRSFGVVAANRGVVAAGPYRWVRHPMYAAYFISHIGFLLLYPSFWNLAVYLTSAGIQIMRLLAEERLLSESAEYRDLMQRVPYRLVPGIF